MAPRRGCSRKHGSGLDHHTDGRSARTATHDRDPTPGAAADVPTTCTRRRGPQQHQHGQPARPRRRAPRPHRAGLRRRRPRARQPDHARAASPPRSPSPSGCSTSWSRSSAPARASPPRPSSACIAMLRAETTERPADVLSPQHPVQPRPHDPAQDAEPEALRRLDRQAHDHLRHRPGRHRQDLPRDGQGRAGAAGQEGQPDHPDPPGRRGGGAARLPARHARARRSTPTCGRSTTRCTTCSTPSRSPSCWPPAPSRSRRWPTCAAAPSTTRSSSSTRRRTPRPSR